MMVRRGAFTLFELILAIALSATLMALIAIAINLYLMTVQQSRDRVEEAQLARSILAMIADDLRAAAIYQPQDVSSVEQMMSESASFDVDSIDEERVDDNDDDTSGPSSPSSPGGVGGATTIGGAGGTSGSGGSGSSFGGDSSTAAEDSDMPLGLSGTLGELYVDVVRMPSRDELFATLTGYTNAPMAMPTDNAIAATMGTMWGATPSPNNLKTVRYFVRDGDRSEATGLAATSLAPEKQLQAGGLVRQVIPRPSRVYAEQTGDTRILESGQVLVAPEVLQIQFRYFDGQQILDVWDMGEERSLPLVIEVTIWLTSMQEAAQGVSAFNAQSTLNTARQYRQTVFLPMAELSQMAAMSGIGGSGGSSSSSSSTSSSFGSTTSGSSTGFGSSSGEQ